MTTTVIVTDEPLNAEATALIARIMTPQPAVAMTFESPASPLPAVPAARDGEIYAGIAFVDGKPSHHLFLLAAKPAKAMDWAGMKKWAEGVGDGLFSRFEGALLYANLKDQFETSSWYWTDTQYSEDYAWGQHVYDGYQDGLYKGHKFLGRAVRRLPL